ncbi:sensor histidine kinase [Chitinophaga nivalis]|uniref:Histidine kinase n=1 Tax=Chitinophaga nivalis TaxID=2991709 RepID=A0ABT3IV57_9BACT|nr:histidine kinase [Chitinophaga nivalis]MCW3462459.1 histidine kinase [Chitinophaga nivalis]MCW3487850.1 histidine kinase [Chitinophaga nivalis]
MTVTLTTPSITLTVTGLLLLFLGLIHYMSRSRVWHRRYSAAAHLAACRQEDMELLRQQLAAQKLLSLKAQVNPHFLFNCLNGIHNTIVTGETAKAQDYISGFARLLRMMLMLADKQFITLQEEADMLEYYLQLEQMRTNNGFDYTLQIDPLISPSVLPVPGMLIQPFLENAIWHGLMNKENDRQLHIHWKKINEQLFCCEVTDNGIGRALAGQRLPEGLKAVRHRSRGMELCMERAELYRNMYHSRFNIDISDIPGPNGTAGGTCVHIVFEVTDDMITGY